MGLKDAITQARSWLVVEHSIRQEGPALERVPPLTSCCASKTSLGGVGAFADPLELSRKRHFPCRADQLGQVPRPQVQMV